MAGLDETPMGKDHRRGSGKAGEEGEQGVQGVTAKRVLVKQPIRRVSHNAPCGQINGGHGGQGEG